MITVESPIPDSGIASASQSIQFTFDDQSEPTLTPSSSFLSTSAPTLYDCQCDLRQSKLHMRRIPRSNSWPNREYMTKTTVTIATQTDPHSTEEHMMQAGTLRIFADNTRQRVLATGPAGGIVNHFNVHDGHMDGAIHDINNNVVQLVAGDLRLIADDFNERRGAFIGLNLRAAVFGIFVAAQIPQWAVDLLGAVGFVAR